MTGEVDQVMLYITTPESVPVTFTVSIPGKDYFYRGIVDPGGVREFTFNGVDYALRNTTDRSKGIIIKAEQEKQVFVYGVQDVRFIMDSFLVLPPHDLGATSYTYIAAMIHTLDTISHGGEEVDTHSLVGIVSVENDTMLTITPTQNVTIGTETVEAGNSIDVTLARAETLLIAFVGDLTGTKVTSNRPISFFCGDQCPYIPSGVPYCDQIVEQLPPVEAWGRQFATAPLKTRSFDVFRIVASANSTTVIVSCIHRSGSQRSVCAFALNEGGYTDVQVSGTDFCWMEADKRILLLQFSVGTRADSMPGDPFMALVPAVSHYTNTFTLPIVNSSLNDFTHYLNIIIPAEHYQLNQIFLDGQSLQSLALEFVAIVHNGETMAYATQVTVTATTHTLMHGNRTGVIGVVSYGFAGSASYGHVGGMQLAWISEFYAVMVVSGQSNFIFVFIIPVCTKYQAIALCIFLSLYIPYLSLSSEFNSEPRTPPTVLTVLEITSSSLTVSWRPPQGQLEEENTIHYLVNVTDTKGKSVVNEVNSTVLSIRVPELLPDHVYQVAVAAVSGERVGPSTTLFARTSLRAATGVYV